MTRKLAIGASALALLGGGAAAATAHSNRGEDRAYHPLRADHRQGAREDEARHHHRRRGRHGGEDRGRRHDDCHRDD